MRLFRAKFTKLHVFLSIFCANIGYSLTHRSLDCLSLPLHHFRVCWTRPDPLRYRSTSTRPCDISPAFSALAVYPSAYTIQTVFLCMLLTGIRQTITNLVTLRSATSGPSHLRSADSLTFDIPRTRTRMGDRALSVAGRCAWHALPADSLSKIPPTLLWYVKSLAKMFQLNLLNLQLPRHYNVEVYRNQSLKKGQHIITSNSSKEFDFHSHVWQLLSKDHKTSLLLRTTSLTFVRKT